MHWNKSVFIIFFLTNIYCFSQENISINYVDSKIEDLIKISTTKKSNTHIEVYSIQLIANEKLEMTTQIKNKYKGLFPSELIDEIFEPPYYKIIVGGYLDKKKAEEQLKTIQNKFKSSFVLKREIPINRFKEFYQKDK